ncbi:fibrillarin 1 [Actinidia rufa]|uniref:Fibrillarin 1 n=1 Tax=Actinidia rufa TaxID=165716 RepID=A0A7J0E6S4_9ERIC|nr:fibrillarin 1 [Actinidia rufa]
MRKKRARRLYRSQELPDLRFQKTCLGFFMNLERHASRTASIGRTERFTYEVEACFCTCVGLASPGDLSRKRKRVAETSCKACGRPLVDGIGRPSATVLSTVSQDLRNFINMGLNWKTVKKGVRSTSRRSRKPAKSLTLGVAVLGRRFGDKLEHVPHKKRKLVLSSLQHHHLESLHHSMKRLYYLNAWQGVEVNGKLVYTEDFSVVKILQGGMDLSISLVEWRGFKSVILD